MGRGAEQECVEPYTERPVAENHHSWLRSASPILREHKIDIARSTQAKNLRGLQAAMYGRQPAICPTKAPSITFFPGLGGA
jgi:hypothetical protein